ncbi:MAG: FtsX-like permease family protein [Eubacterium sp.]|nr:FtsX-like permease family protein [Eubacterium sp.]
MTWPFENDTSAIEKKLAKRSLKSEKRRNMMVMISVALAAFLVCFTGIVSTSVMQIQRNQVVDTYEAVWLGIDETDIETLKELPEFARVGGYYALGQEHSEQGYHASYVYCDEEMMYIARNQMNLLEGRVPEKANEVVVSEYFLSTYGNNAKIGETVILHTDSFHGEYTVTGIMDSVGEKEANTCAIILSKAALTEWIGFDSAGYRAYVHFKNDTQLDEETMTAYCREIASNYDLPPVGMNSTYLTYYSRSIDFAALGSVALLVLVGGYIVIQSIFRISINDKIKSYGQLRTIGTTSKQVRRIVKKEGRRLGSIGILAGVMLGVCGGFILFPKGFNAFYYGVVIVLAVLISWFMVSISIRKPIKIASNISPLEAVRFSAEQKTIHSRKKNIKLNPVSMGIANFKRDRKKTISIVASLSLGGIFLLIIASALLTRSPEQYARQFYPDGDYKIYMDSDQSEIELMAAGNPLNEELKLEILSIDGVTDVIEKREAIHGKVTAANSNSTSGACDILNEKNYHEAEHALIAGSLPTGEHEVVIGQLIQEYLGDIEIGTTLELSVGQEVVPVTVSGIFDTKKVTNGHGTLAMDATQMFLSREFAEKVFPEIENFNYSWSIVSEPEKAQSVENGLRNIVANHSNISLDTFSIKKEYQEAQNSVIFGGLQALSWLIFLFGVINLINTTLSNQISRKRENSILRSVGLTGKQLCQMNIYEGLCYATFAALATLIVGLPIAIIVSRKISMVAFAGEIVPYQFPVLEMGLFILVLFGMELILSVWTVNRQKKQSLIEQMRSME